MPTNKPRLGSICRRRKRLPDGTVLEFVALRRVLPEEIRPVSTFAYHTSCRRGEILSLVWSQADLTNRVVRLDPGTTTNDEGRLLPLAPELHEVLAMQKAIRDAKYPTCSFMICGAPALGTWCAQTFRARNHADFRPQEPIRLRAV